MPLKVRKLGKFSALDFEVVKKVKNYFGFNFFFDFSRKYLIHLFIVFFFCEAEGIDRVCI
jgi:hypothetical protein